MKNFLQKIIASCIGILLCFNTSSIIAQCVAGGTLSPSSSVNNTSAGSVIWLGMTNALLSDNVYLSSTSAIGVLGSAQSNYVNTSNYGFAIPTTASICGIKVEVERNAAGLLVGSSIKDKSLSMIKGGSLIGADYANTSTSWPGTDAVAVYGGSTDTWGTTWTPADINSANFGFAISTEMKAGLVALLLTSNIDKISVTVFYNTIVLPVETTFFTGEVEEHSVKLEWKTASETNNKYFSVEKMNTEYGWNELAQVAGAGNSSTLKEYSIYDKNPSALNYYRIKEVDYDHQESYSKIISVEYSLPHENTLVLYPLPVAQILSIQTKYKIEKVEVISDKGIAIVPDFYVNKDTDIDVGSLATGIYIIKVYTNNDVQVKRFIKE